MGKVVRLSARLFSGKIHFLIALVFLPANLLLGQVLRWRVRRNSAAHIGLMYHPHGQTALILKRRGFDVTYFGVGPASQWSHADFHLPDLFWFGIEYFRDLWIFWRHLAQHEIIHMHSMNGLSHYQWDVFVLRSMGRRVVAHFRGCEARQRDVNMAASPRYNICQECDYAPSYLCAYSENRRRRWAAAKCASTVLVTTPDLLDHWPQGRHVPFFLPVDAPESPERPHWAPDSGRPLTVVHITNQPGIEGTESIRLALAHAKRKGAPVEFNFVCGAPREVVYRALAEADLSIGKMKMGYYANAQIEALAMGLPVITWVRDDLRTPAMDKGGLVLTSLDELERTILSLVDSPALLARLQDRARDTALALHDEERIVSQLLSLYGWDASARRTA